jgi:hypothetical protein
MAHFSASLYNHLAGVQQASAALAVHSNRKRLFDALAREINDAGLIETLFVTLSHRHTMLDDDRIIVRRREERHNETVLCSRIVDPRDAGEVVPCVWAVTDQQGIPAAVPVEFSAESDMISKHALLRDNAKVFDRIASVISENGLTQLVGFGLISDFACETQHGDYYFLEKIELEPEFEQTLYARSRDETEKEKAVETTWQFFRCPDSANVYDPVAVYVCVQRCLQKCVMYSPGHAIEHEDKHVQRPIP